MTANKACMTRLQKEYKALLKDPVPHITAHPSPSSMLEWYFVLEGAKGTDYENGVYLGKLVFPPQYPFKPPSISLFTPNGRFAVNTKLCLSMTDFHPESWNPLWSIGTILTGLLSFMVDPQPTTGSITTTSADKRRYAAESLAFNMKNPTFRKLFPSWVELAESGAAGAAPADAEVAPAAAAAAGEEVPAAAAVGQQGQAAAAPPPGSSAPDGRQQGAAATAAAAAAPQPGAERAPGGKPGAAHKGSPAMTLAVVLVLVAMAVVPLISGRGALRMFGAG